MNQNVRLVEVRRESISPALYNYILKRDKNTCRYCGEKQPPFNLDHVYPVIKGGETSVANLVTSCKACNERKHTSIIFPKPIGYFDHAPSISMFNVFLVALGVSCVANGLWVLEEFLVYSKASITLGLIVLAFSLVRISTGR